MRVVRLEQVLHKVEWRKEQQLLVDAVESKVRMFV